MNRVFSLLVFSVIFSHFTLAQTKVLSFDQAPTLEIDIQQLDEQYPPALGPGSEVVYKDQDQAFIKAYAGMLNQLNRFLNEKGFYWETPVRCFNRVYFNEKGTVDYYLFQFKTGTVSDVKQKQFAQLVEKFLNGYQFEMSHNKRFAQCSPVLYQDI